MSTYGVHAYTCMLTSSVGVSEPGKEDATSADVAPQTAESQTVQVSTGCLTGGGVACMGV